jgi:hypothetical protein
MRSLPETAHDRSTRQRVYWPVVALVGILIVVFVTGVTSLFRGGGGFTPGESRTSTGVQDIVVSGEDSLYPPPDVDTFSVSPEVLRVYLIVEGMSDGRLEASVVRADRATVLSWLFVSGGELEVGGEAEERLVRDGGKVSGMIKFSIRSASGEPVSPGDYTVSVSQAGGERPIATKSFVVSE